MIVNERKYFFFDKLVDQSLFLPSERERLYDTLDMRNKKLEHFIQEVRKLN